MKKYENAETRKKIEEIVKKLEEIQKEAKQIILEHNNNKIYLKIKSQSLLEITNIFIDAVIEQYNKKNWYE